jgi:hypothetical protein
LSGNYHMNLSNEKAGEFVWIKYCAL